MIVTTGARAADSAPQRFTAEWPELVAWLNVPPAPGPKDGAWICFADFGGGQRSYANLVGSYAVPLDLDLGQYAWTADDIAARLAGYKYAAWTSYSHTPERPRWRIVVPVERPMSRAEHYATWETLADLFLRDCGESSKDATRLNYLPGTAAHPEHAQFVSVTHGEYFPVSVVPEGTGLTDEPLGAYGLTDEPVAGWAGPTDDDALITYMRQNRRNAEDAFGGGPTRFEALWTADAAALAVTWPPTEPDQLFDHTRADAALANELAFYTGSHGTRCLDLFLRSQLADRPKFREDKARRAILLACQRNPDQHAFMSPASRIAASPSVTISVGPVEPSTGQTTPTAPASASVGAGPDTPPANLGDFFAYLPDHTYIHRPTGSRWPAASLDGTVGKDARMMLDLTHPVHGLSWAPGLPERFQMRELDTTNERAAETYVYNTYQPPRVPQRVDDPKPWLDLLRRLYPTDADHILRYFADAIQNPGRKCNHALVLGSRVHGIGKDTLLKPLRWGVGERNFAVVEPKDLFADFNPWAASVVVQISESRNIGDGDGGRISKYDLENKIKNLAAAPPETILMNVKHVSQQPVKNVSRLVITTNHGIDGIYITPEDRRHYCAWSDAPAMTGEEGEWLHKWLDAGGSEAVANFLAHFPLDDWQPGAPPPKTEWWHRLVLEGNQQDDNPLSDALDKLGKPEWITAERLAKEGGPDVASWFADSRNRKQISRHLSNLGYTRVHNPSDKRGRYQVGKERATVYSRVAVNRDWYPK